MSEYFSRDELRSMPRSELNDTGVFNLAFTTFGVSARQIIIAAFLTHRGTAHPTLIDHTHHEFYIMGRAPNDVRCYALECLVGDRPMIMDEEGKQCVLLA